MQIAKDIIICGDTLEELTMDKKIQIQEWFNKLYKDGGGNANTKSTTPA